MNNPWIKMLSYMSGNVNEDLLKKVEYLIEENRILRNQLTNRIKLTDAERISLAEKAVALGKMMRDTVTIVKPDTILKWFRQLCKVKWDYSERVESPGRPPVKPEIEMLTVKFAKENPNWGYDKIAGALNNLGHAISDTTVGNILRKHGIAPTDERKKNTTWNQFIKQHKDVLYATDFFTWEVPTLRKGLLTFYVLIFINLQTKQIIIGGITQNPDGEWMKQIARNMTDAVDFKLKDGRYLIHDRDDKFTLQFRALMRSSGIKPIRLPPRSPNLNAYAERWVRSVKEECLSQLILIGQKSLEYTIKQYIDHFHAERNHQGIENRIPFPDHERLKNTGTINKKERLGGLLNYYYRASA